METASDIHRLTSGNESPRIDSGYATATSTAFNTPKDPEKSQGDSNPWSSADLGHCTSGNRGDPIPFKLAGYGIPTISDRFPNEATELRFKFVMEQMEFPLHKYIQKSRLRRQPNLPMSIRLAMLDGISAEDVRPGIVVLCRENLVKRVRRYFDKPEPKSLCRPTDSKLPQFEVIVIGKAPQLTMARGDLQIFAQLPSQASSKSTFYGTPIKVNNGIHTRVATMGGIIMVRYTDGRDVLYGMTAGHVAKQLQLQDKPSTKDHRLSRSYLLSEKEGSQDEAQTHADNDGEESDYFSSEDEQEGDRRAKFGFSRHYDPFGANSAPILGPSPVIKPPVNGSKEWESLGDVTTLADCKSNARYYDWSLVTIDQEKIARNVLHDRSQNHKFPPGDLKLPTRSLEYPNRRSVVMASGTHGLRHGTISNIPTKFLSAPGQSFVEVYSLRLNGDAEIYEGESGSWIIDQKTLEVYGHLVASDALGYGYVIPLSETFKNILQQLGAVSVDLPSAFDILCFNTMPSRPCTPPPLSSLTLFNDSGYNSHMTTPEQVSHSHMTMPKQAFNPNLGSSTTAVIASEADHEAKDATDGEESGRECSEEMKDVERLRKRKRILWPY